MAAASTDLFKKGARKWVGQIGAAGVSDASVTTIPLTSATGLPTDTGVDIVVDRVDSTGTKTPNLEETITGVVSGSNLVTCVRGVEGTAQAHLAGAVVEVVITANTWNDVIDGLLVGHTQAGAHTAASDTVSGVVELATTAETTTGTDATRAVTPDGLHDMTSLAGAAWFLDEDTMSSDSATKVASQQSIKAYVATQVSSDGWTASGETWTYASATSFTVAGSDVTAKYPKGTKIKLTQTTAKYFYVVSTSFSTDTTINVTGGSDYTVANAAITAPYFSYLNVAQGFPQWFNYAPAYTGFSADPGNASINKFCVTGNICTVIRDAGNSDGTSNATSFTMTFPISASGGTSELCFVKDGGANITTPGHILFTDGSATASIHKTFYNGAWTNSGGKNAFFTASYRI